MNTFAIATVAAANMCVCDKKMRNFVRALASDSPQWNGITHTCHIRFAPIAISLILFRSLDIFIKLRRMSMPTHAQWFER